MIKLHELVDDIGAVEKQLRDLESKYGVLSGEFYQAFTSGELSEFDACDEYRMEFITWAALCQTRQKLGQAYQRLGAHQPAAVRIRLQLATA